MSASISAKVDSPDENSRSWTARLQCEGNCSHSSAVPVFNSGHGAHQSTGRGREARDVETVRVRKNGHGCFQSARGCRRVAVSGSLLFGVDLGSSFGAARSVRTNSPVAKEHNFAVHMALGPRPWIRHVEFAIRRQGEPNVFRVESGCVLRAAIPIELIRELLISFLGVHPKGHPLLIIGVVIPLEIHKNTRTSCAPCGTDRGIS